MERLRNLSQFWNYLPAFRAVAENEHLPTATRELGVSAPALSRSVRLLEEQLGQPLFHRLPKRLELNQAGQIFLRHLREAMRRLDDGLQLLRQSQFAGPLRVSASNSASLVFAVPALRVLQRRHPLLVPELQSWDPARACEELRKGHIDLALVEGGEVELGLSVELLARFTYGVYAAPGQPVLEHAHDLERVLEQGFVAASPGVQDQWPPELQRKVRLRVSALNLAIACCAAGEHLALLPDQVARLYPEQLVRLPVGTLAENKVLMVSRTELGGEGVIPELRQELRQVAAGAS
jgi:DNA-binding transcriptional LysR family regulator